ncbi:hypothetical protein BKA70DRAFT_1326695 [Coprinopsis sp. MPI-PUGE-AT-0042]|nr:hypothetical protein BKA70DRAFT_1326695 [Coprinopsis sp. MPI-PUGE-AT-0042]
MDFAQEEPGVAMEIIRAIGKELKEAPSRLRSDSTQTEAAVVAQTSVSEVIYRKLKEEYDELADEAWKWRLKAANLQSEIETMRTINQEPKYEDAEKAMTKSEDEEGDWSIPGLTLASPGSQGNLVRKEPQACSIASLQHRISELEAANNQHLLRAEESDEKRREAENRLSVLDEVNRQTLVENEALRAKLKEMGTGAREREKANEDLCKERLRLGIQATQLERERDSLLQTLKNTESNMKYIGIEASTWQRHCLEEGTKRQDLEQEVASLQAQLKRVERNETKMMKETLENTERAGKVWALSHFQALCTSFPGAGICPINDEPICALNRRHQLLDSIGKTPSLAGMQVVYLPDSLHRLHWVGNNSEHIVFFCPRYVYDGGKGRWYTGRGIGQKGVGGVIVLFDDGKALFYAGTYRMHSTKANNPRGALIKPSVETAQALAGATVINGVKPGWNTVNPQYAMQEAMKEILKEMYMSGVLKVEGVILEYLSRDPDVTSELRKSSGSGSSKRKRSRSSERCSDSDSSSGNSGILHPAKRGACS